MNTWDKKTEDYAVAHHTYERLEESVNQWGYRMIREGARWQREALLSDEAVDRVAAVLADMNGEPRTGRFERTMARVALAAAMGDE